MEDRAILPKTMIDKNSKVDGGVAVKTYGRLHLGFLDPSGGATGQFGSLGISIDSPELRLTLKTADEFRVTGCEIERSKRYLTRLISHFGTSSGFHLDLIRTIPAHAGLGSGTQLALSIGSAFAELNHIKLSTADIAKILDRGKRSGIGIGAFETGGVLFDGGRQQEDSIPIILSRFDFPGNWRILLIYSRNNMSIHGGEEFEAFESLPPFSHETTADLCRRMVMNALPAIAENDFETFSHEVKHLQNCMGEYFACAQGGFYTSAEVGEALSWIESQGIVGVGQSSWGPTGFALLKSERQGIDLVTRAQEKWPKDGELSFELARGWNHGALVEKISNVE